jgi:hypothetical protein
VQSPPPPSRSRHCSCRHAVTQSPPLPLPSCSRHHILHRAVAAASITPSPLPPPLHSHHRCRRAVTATAAAIVQSMAIRRHGVSPTRSDPVLAGNVGVMSGISPPQNNRHADMSAPCFRHDTDHVGNMAPCRLLRCCVGVVSA